MGLRNRIITAIVLMAALSVAVYAYLSANSKEVVNDFTAATDPAPSVTETFADNCKSDVKVDIGTPGYAVYVRAAIVITWQDDEGNVYAVPPVADTDYTLQVNTEDWFLGTDGFYYHYAPVNSGNDTQVLIKKCVQTATAPAGYALNVQIMAQTVQALGSTDENGTPAVTDAWKINVDADGKLKN